MVTRVVKALKVNLVICNSDDMERDKCMQGKTKKENQTITQFYCDGDRTWEDQSIPAPIQDNTVSGMRLCQWRPDSGPPHIRLPQT